jgi:hypothetical protein
MCRYACFECRNGFKDILFKIQGFLIPQRHLTGLDRFIQILNRPTFVRIDNVPEAEMARQEQSAQSPKRSCPKVHG